MVLQVYLPLISMQDLNFDQGYSGLCFSSPEVHADSVGCAEGDSSSESGQDQDPELFARRLQLLLSNSRVLASTLSQRS